ncbi:hypothetical protein F0L74_31865 [Chitinophaga agrisoli]|uniref:Uncharacterized protein n=1 Tax=Chitinophaga agrisoli TaxID=2607653 RepID=A0A5B2VPY7_9BACT|nr:hypothetical protein [Chitinophaga agrisoli]KAA2240738.1 hypothetical protein F0L74_31865 [Chitinophaga agrisoli]
MAKLKNIWVVLVHVFALCFSYGAGRIAISWVLGTDFKLLGSAFWNAFFAFGILVVLPILGIITIRYHRHFLRVMGWVYLALWGLALLRMMSIFMHTA